MKNIITFEKFSLFGKKTPDTILTTLRNIIKNNNYKDLDVQVDDSMYDTKTTYTLITKLGNVKVVEVDQSYVAVYIDDKEVGRSNKTSDDKLPAEIFNILSEKVI